MALNIIDYGGELPTRAHLLDAGADVYCPYDLIINPHETVCIGLGIGVELEPNTVGFILPRSSMAKYGVVAQAVPIDTGYQGELHAIITNYGENSYTITKGDRIAQLVILPCILETFKMISKEQLIKSERNTGAFASTGK